ncbi:MAG: adenylyl-sulfate kinase [Thermodesulfobacteriota bacterium]|nr:adenylyl-sulfate kinase [Thermodesulfobacteriota bacterium]
MKNSITWFNGHISREDREDLHGHKGAVVWFTGLSASGKSTIAHLLEKLLHEKGSSTYVFDGDNVRHGLCQDLGFLPEDRTENIRRIGEMVKLFVDAGVIAITAFISPYRNDRDRIRDLVGNDRFYEIYVRCPIEVCAERDPKGLYEKAQRNLIRDFTGITAPYERPEHPSLVIDSSVVYPEDAARMVMDVMIENRILFKEAAP